MDTTTKRIKITGEITHDASAIDWCLPPPAPCQPAVIVLTDNTAGDLRAKMRELLADMNGPSFGIRITYPGPRRSVPIMAAPDMLAMRLISYHIFGQHPVSITWISMLVRALRQCGIVEQVHAYSLGSNERENVRLVVPGFEDASIKAIEHAGQAIGIGVGAPPQPRKTLLEGGSS